MIIDRVSKAINSWVDRPSGPLESRLYAKIIALKDIKKSHIQIFLALAFFAGAWWYEGSLIVALTLLIAIYGHEQGHLWAMRSVGMGIHGSWFIPFLGGVTISKDDSQSSNWERWLVAVMGPLWGFLMALFPFLIFYYSLNDHLHYLFRKILIFGPEKTIDGATVVSFAIIWVKVVRGIALINLLNLLPLPILDGGRMISEMILSLSRKATIIFLAIFLLLAGWMVFKIGSVFLIVLSVLGVIGIWVRWTEQTRNGGMSGAELLIAVFVHISLSLGLMWIAFKMDDHLNVWEMMIDRRKP